MGKSGNKHLFPCHRYFDKSFTEIFLESSTKHMNFVQITDFDGCHCNRKAKFSNKILKIFFSEVIRGRS